MGIFSIVKFVYISLLVHLTWGECRLKSLNGDTRKYTLSLWGDETMGSCQTAERFDGTRCTCVKDNNDDNNNYSPISPPAPEGLTNAKRADIREVPWAVSYQFQCGINGTYQCSGVLIEHRWALTAYHCVDIDCNDTLDITVYGGRSIIGDRYHHQAAWAKVVDWYHEDKYGDIVLLELDRDMHPRNETGSTVKYAPVMEPGNRNNDPMHMKCVTAGFGWQGETRDCHLYKAKMMVLEQHLCYPEWRNLSWSICATNEESVTCPGDSGGGLVCKDHNGEAKVLGVLSEGYDPCYKQPNWAENMFASAQAFQPYIQSIIQSRRIDDVSTIEKAVNPPEISV